jgi:predicted metal-dependent hydrolase
MLQLQMNFLGRQIERFRSSRLPPPDLNQPLAWKHGLTVQMLQRPRARRYLLRLQPNGTVRLVIPRRGSRTEAMRFLERSEAWLLKQRALWQKRRASRRPWLDASRFPFRGEETVLCLENSNGMIRLSFADQIISLSRAMPDYREIVFGHLRRLAEMELPARTIELARHHHIVVNRVTVRAQKTRWGSCSARGTISLNWRLIQAPAYVVDYLIIHELMHRREMNHSARYWKHVADAFPDYQLAEKWLKSKRLDGDYWDGAAPA